MIIMICMHRLKIKGCNLQNTKVSSATLYQESNNFSAASQYYLCKRKLPSVMQAQGETPFSIFIK